MCIETEKRYEIKMVLNQKQLTYFYSWMNASTTLKESFPSRCVNSIYLDDLDLTSVKDNLSGIPDRRKLRLRYYGEDEYYGLAFEIKNKVGRLGYKNICNLSDSLIELKEMKYHEVSEFLHNRLISTKSSNLIKHTSNLIFPLLKVTYMREYYETVDSIRLTVDDNIKYKLPMQFDKVVNPAKDFYDKKIVEVKFAKKQKDDVANLLRSLRLTPRRHSKYLTGLAMYKVVSYV